MHKPESILENEMHEILWEFEMHIRYVIQTRRRDFVLVNFVVLWILLFQRITVKIREDEKLNKYLDLARELKKLCNMMVTVIPIIVRALGTVPKNQEKRLDELEIKRKTETIQTSALLGYLEESWRPEETCCHSTSNKNHQLELV